MTGAYNILKDKNDYVFAGSGACIIPDFCFSGILIIPGINCLPFSHAAEKLLLPDAILSDIITGDASGVDRIDYLLWDSQSCYQHLPLVHNYDIIMS